MRDMRGTSQSKKLGLWQKPGFWPAPAVIGLMLAFTVWFSAYGIRLHDAHLTHKSDLGQMDQAIWNTAHGRFVAETKLDHASTRMTDHVEPIFLPASLVFWAWDDVRALIVLQAAALAAGAWPVYLFARRRLENASGPGAPVAAWGGAVFAAAYLLAPALQAPAASEFHAFGLAPPLIAWAIWAVEARRWGHFAWSAVLLIGVQEGIALLGAGLGAYAMIKGWRTKRFAGRIVGPAILLLGLAWFYLTTFVIIPHFAGLEYGIGQTPYAARYGALGDGFGDVIKGLLTRPAVAAGILSEPLRIGYLAGLALPTVFLALLGPEVLALSLPLLLANVFSAYPFQYSGELHYSAPLVPYFVMAAAVGLGRVGRFAKSPQTGTRTATTTGRSGASLYGRLRRWALPAGLAAIMIASIGYQAAAGYTPIGGQYRVRVPGGWPQVTEHDLLLDGFAAQIPDGAALSTTPDLYPHLTHRQWIYQFPTVGAAEWALVDVAGTTDRPPSDIRGAIEGLLAAGWGVVDAADGYALLSYGRGAPALPDAFYDFARATAEPRHGLDVTFGGKLRLVGYDIIDNEKWRGTRLRLYWLPEARLPAGASISIRVATPDGAVVADSAQQPVAALSWYPPAAWQPGETVVTETGDWYLPAAWAPLVRVEAGGQTLTPVQAGGAPAIDPKAGPAVPDAADDVVVTGDGALRLPAWARMPRSANGGGELVPWAGPARSGGTPVRFTEPGGWSVTLAAAPWLSTAPDGGALRVMLPWEATDAAPSDFTVFVHLRDLTGRTVADGDAGPSWFTAQPASGWAKSGPRWDAHSVSLPAGIAPGAYSLVIGWYSQANGQRLSVLGPDGNPQGNEFVVGIVDIDPSKAPAPDLACLLNKLSCDSGAGYAVQ